MLDWLRGDGHEDAGVTHAIEDIQLLPRSPSRRACATFTPTKVMSRPAGSGVAARSRRPGTRLRPSTFPTPPASAAPEKPCDARTPPECSTSSCKIAAVIGADLSIAGFTLLNDFSARDVQREEVTVGLGPAKAKDFATALGPWLVTPDELPLVDGRLKARGDGHGQRRRGDTHRCGRATLHLGRDRRAGGARHAPASRRRARLRDAEPRLPAQLGPLPGDRWLQPGDTVTLAAEGLGSLVTPIVS